MVVHLKGAFIKNAPFVVVVKPGLVSVSATRVYGIREKLNAGSSIGLTIEGRDDSPLISPPYRPNVMAQTQLESMLGISGCFVFTDSLPQPPAPVHALQASSSGAPLLSSQGPRKLTDRDNQMVVIARGGAIFQTGHTHSTRMLGSVLKPGASCWSSLSDRNLKVNVSNVDTQIVADSLMHHVPISTWQYKSGTNAERDPDHQDGHGVRRGGGGGEVRHVGPMAQDLWEAFEVGSDPRRIDTIDSDGITLAAVQGAAHKQRRCRLWPFMVSTADGWREQNRSSVS
jgi:hypothetical protein